MKTFYFVIVFPIIVISAIIYIVKNTKNPNEKNVVTKEYDFSVKDKEEKNESNN